MDKEHIGRSVTKNEILKSMSILTDETQKDCAKFYDAFVEVLKTELSVNKNDVKLRELGTFRIQRVKPRKYTDFRTGKKKMSKEKFNIKFSPSRQIKDRLDPSNEDDND